MIPSFYKKNIRRILSVGLSAALTAGVLSSELFLIPVLAQEQAESLSETEAVSELLSEPETEAVSEPQSETGTEAASEPETQKEPAVITALDQRELIAEHPVIEIIRNDLEDRSPLMYAVYNLWTLSATAVLPDGTTESLTLSTEWTLGDYTLPQIDVSTVGTYTETGTILIPDGYVLAEGIPQEINIPVNVYIPEEPIPIASTEMVNSCAYAFSSGTSMDEILSTVYLKQNLLCYDANGNAFSAPIHWDTGALDPTVPGVYTITASIASPEYTVFPETLNLPKPEVTVSIQAADSPEINSCYYNYGQYTFPWIAQSEEVLSGMSVWISVDDGPWAQYTEEEHDVYCWEDGLYLPENLITDGRSYRIQVDYEGGSTSIVSFQYSMSDDRIITDIVDGDRDGGDSGGTDLGPTIQPPPVSEDTEPDQEHTTESESETEAADESEPETKTADESEPETEAADESQSSVHPESGSQPAEMTERAKEFLEIFAEDYDLISGTRLRMTMDISGTAQFSKHGITVCLDPNTVALWNITDEDRIRITIRQEGAHAFVFSLEVNDKPVTAVENTRIMVPGNASGSRMPVLLLDEENVIQSLGISDPVSGTAAFSVDQTGHFTLYESASVSNAVLAIREHGMSFCVSLMYTLRLLPWMATCSPIYIG